VDRDRLLTAAVLARDEAGIIERCLAALAWADERLVVVDAATTDDTAARAAALGARVVTRRLESFAAQRNAALELTDAAWVLFVDADEVVTPALAAEVQRAVASAGEVVGFWIPRRNLICGRWVRHAGWYPDEQLRLLRRGRAQYDADKLVHEVVQLDGPAGHLREPLVHYNYADLAQFRRKQARYAELEVETLAAQGVRPRPYTPFLQPLREFRRRYVTLEGYKEGLLGLQLCGLLAWSTFTVYRELARHRAAA
jgi:glycosyltransferase involved in cell wall biosynthesis